MTTGRINQVCQMLLRNTYSPMQAHGSAWLSSKSAMVHIKHNSNAHKEAPPSKLELTTWRSRIRTARLSKETDMRRRPPARTQITVCYQAVAQYPESFNDHKETPWQISRRRLPLYPCSLQWQLEAWSQALAATELAYSQESCPSQYSTYGAAHTPSYFWRALDFRSPSFIYN